MKGPAFFMVASSWCYLVVVKCLPPTFSVIQSSDESTTKINIPNFYFLNTIMISYKQNLEMVILFVTNLWL